uniref:Uncharacterized protein n=1 Tax=Amphimedon queenslandica TaxID=400682 RepID=A0A1X7T1R8_AMPQE
MIIDTESSIDGDRNGTKHRSFVLTVNSIPDNDGLGIGCEVITFNPFDRVISNCNLTIRGVSSVEDLQYDFTSNNSLLITWSRPVYYSDDVSFGSSVSYQVLVTDEEDGDIILDETIANRKIKVVNVTKCDTFNISVTVILAQYTSTDIDSNSGNFSIAEYGTQPLIPSISFELGCPLSKCLVSLMDGSTEVTDIISETDHIIEFKLSPFRHYELTAVVKNLRGKTKATYDASISTFHTRDIIISSPHTDGSVSVQCVFVSGSTADGCHVIFNDTNQEIVESFTITGPGSTIVTVSASGVYDVYVYDIVKGSLYGPAVQDTTLVEIVKVIPSTFSSSSIMSESTASPAQSTVSNTVSPTTTSINVTGTTSSTSKTMNDNNIIVPIVAGTVSGSVLLILIILVVCAVIIVNKRKKMKGVLIRSEFATIQQPQAETNRYQDVHELRNEGPNNTSPLLLTSSRLINEENPYHVTRSK